MGCCISRAFDRVCIHACFAEQGWPEVFLDSIFKFIPEALVCPGNSESCSTLRVCAMQSIVQLASPGGLGSDMATRYVLPPLMAIFCKPRRAVPSRSARHTSWGSLLQDSDVEKFGRRVQWSPDAGLRSCILAEGIVGVSQRVGEIATIECILPHVFSMLPIYLREMKAMKDDDAGECNEVEEGQLLQVSRNLSLKVIEVLQILAELMTGVLSMEMVVSHFVENPPKEALGLSLHRFIELLALQMDGSAANASSLELGKAGWDQSLTLLRSSAYNPLRGNLVTAVYCKVFVKLCERLQAANNLDRIFPSLNRIFSSISSKIDDGNSTEVHTAVFSSLYFPICDLAGHKTIAEYMSATSMRLINLLHHPGVGNGPGSGTGAGSAGAGAGAGALPGPGARSLTGPGGEGREGMQVGGGNIDGGGTVQVNSIRFLDRNVAMEDGELSSSKASYAGDSGNDPTGLRNVSEDVGRNSVAAGNTSENLGAAGSGGPTKRSI